VADVYECVSRASGEAEIWELRGPEGTCSVVPSAGSQLGALALRPDPAASPVEVLFGPGPERVRQVGWGGGAPILFPFPGRVGGGEFPYRGITYRIPGGHGRGHPLHGFVGLAPWHVEDAGADAAGAWIRTRIDHGELGVPPEAFPGEYRLEVTHRLGGGRYRHEVRVVNTGSRPFPFGYGWHPYFRAPLLPGGSRAECRIRLPAEARWELTPDLLPTGRRLAVAGPYDLRAGSPLGDKSYDDPFTLLVPDEDGGSRAELEDPAAGLRLVVGAGPAFRHWVVYSPRSLGAVALEPYTCAPDAFRLEARGIPAGMLELQPGQSWTAEIWVELRGAR
jgi:aldose 1-epimerase